MSRQRRIRGEGVPLQRAWTPGEKRHQQQTASVEKDSPPTTAMAKGLSNAPPEPTPTTSGIRATSVARVVMRMGRGEFAGRTQSLLSPHSSLLRGHGLVDQKDAVLHDQAY